jgi:hypothetical protein
MAAAMASGITDKVERLVRSGAVAKLQEGRYAVRGDHGAYLVAIVDVAVARAAGVPFAGCTCPAANTGCTHILAVGEVLKLEREGGPMKIQSNDGYAAVA